MNVVDSSGWIVFFGEAADRPHFREVIEARDHLIVPSIAIYEVYKWMLRERDADAADLAVATMAQARVVELDRDLAIDAAVLATRHRLAMADAVILATARSFAATLWTQDADFSGIEGVRYIPRG